AAEARLYILLVEATDARPREALVGIGGWRKDARGKWELPRTRGTVIRLQEIDMVIAALQKAREIARGRGCDAGVTHRNGTATTASPAETNADAAVRPGADRRPT